MRQENAHNPNIIKASEIDLLFRLSRQKSVVNFKKGDIVFREKTKPNGVYYLKEGEIRVFRTGAGNHEKELGTADPGYYLGLNSLMRNKNHVGTAVAVEDSVVYHIPRAEFLKLTEKFPQISHQLLVKLCSLLDKAEENLAAICNNAVKEKLAETILILGKGIKSGKLKKSVFISCGDMAKLIGATQAAVAGYLHELQEDKLISVKENEISLLDNEGLKKICSLK